MPGDRGTSGVTEKYGTYQANLVIVYLPWGNLLRGLTNFHQVPFWSDSPGLASAEFFRHGTWRLFGTLSKRWKSGVPNALEEILKLNLTALKGIRDHCRSKGIPVYFFWSPYRAVLAGEAPDELTREKQRYNAEIRESITVDIASVLRKAPDLDDLYKDDCHYSAEGHRIVGEHLAAFIAARRQDVSTTH